MIHWSSKKISIIVILTIISVFIIPIAYNVFNHNNLGTVIDKSVINLPSSSAIPEIEINSLPAINYQELNDLWYEQKVEMLIVINDSSYLNAVAPLVEWKNFKGVKTIVVYNYSEYEGRDKAEKIRNMIKSYYSSENLRWVLLAGDAEENLLPIRYVYNPDTAEISGESEYSNWDEYYKPTDFYYADLTGSWDDNNNNKFGESATKSGGVDEISWIPEVYVGRLPADNPSELSLMINKTLDYEKAVNAGNWMNRMLLAGGVSSYAPPVDEARLTELIWQNSVVSEINFTHLTKTTSSFTPTTPPPPNELKSLDQTSFRDGLNSGYSSIIFAGHGDPTIFSDASHTTYYRDTDASSSSNWDMPSLIYGDVCTSSSYDKGDFSIGERLIKRPNSGAIGYIGGLRVTWYYEVDPNLEGVNRGNARLFWHEFFEEKKFQQGKALYDSKVSYLNSDYFNSPYVSTELETERKNLLSYNLLGDPEVDIYTNIPLNASNPFTHNFYEGQLVSLQITDIHNNSVPFARMNLKTEDGKNRTVYADEDGYIKFRLPAQSNQNYSVLITGHNLLPSFYNFETIPDLDNPVLSNITCYPNNPSVSDNMVFSIEANDYHSGIESVFVLLYSNNFQDYTILKATNAFQENNFNFNLILNKLEPDDYSYVCIARDYSNKTTIFYNDSCNFIIQKPFSDWALLISIFMIIGLASLSTIILLISLKKSRQDIP
jgi:hypothetical protein